ncbi:hypothetical protein ACFXG4_07720 [Nocardia sp. NPDC059246]|uniref:hypothetical protein n=1 Tax=unclassified Nocardia TaxID=2637762 RepID=UPI0036A3665C
MSESTRHANLSVYAAGALAEYVCQAEPLGMTTRRVQQLRDLRDGARRNRASRSRSTHLDARAYRILFDPTIIAA